MLLVAASLWAQSTVPRFERDSAFPLELKGKQKIDTGFLVVREDRSRPDGRLIRLPVAILRSSNPQPPPDPVVYLPGGPGGSALNTARYGFAYPFLQHRDFIIFEPRGAKYAQPSLICPEVPAARVEDRIRPANGSVVVDAEVSAARKCREQLLAAGIEVSAYTTESSAADVDDLRRVLGYEQWNLYGVSYGTRLGLSILKEFPGTVRSAVFDSVLPPSVRYDEWRQKNRTHSFDILFRDCEADPACREAYPQLRARWRSVLNRAAQQGLRANGRVDKDAPPREVVISTQSLTDLVPLDETGSLAGLPRVLKGIADGNEADLSQVAGWSLQPSNYSWGLRYSVWCSEETPFVKRSTANTERLVVSPRVCQAWNVRPVPSSAHRRVQSDVPVLLLSGEYDPETPPAWAMEAAKTLPRAQTAVFRGMSHVPSQDWSTPCAMSLADAFLRSPGAPLDKRCMTAMKSPVFKVEPRQPKP
jgi:pimeloyl-ACP methyl ester carboxylesterase